jgi:hypothetical protein
MAFDPVSLIALGLQWVASNQAADAQTTAASDFKTGLEEAAKPKTVKDPTGQAVWNEEKQQYEIVPSAPMMGLFGANLNDAYRQRKMIEEYMLDPESAAQQRANKSIGFMTDKRNRLGQDLLGTLNRKGLLTSSFGADAVSDFDTGNALEDYSILESNRTGVQNEIDSYINRSNSAQRMMQGYGSIGQNLANIGTGMGSTAADAYNLGGTQLMNAQQAVGMAKPQMLYGLGQHMMGYANQDPYRQLAMQSEYTGKPTGYAGSVW